MADNKFQGSILVKGKVKLPNEVADRALIIDGSGQISPSTVTSTELGYLAGSTGSLQPQITDNTTDIADLVTLTGVPANSVDLGSFTGAIVPNNSDIKEAIQALISFIVSLPDPMEYKGTWDATTNTPTLTDGTGNNGDVYYVETAGTQFTPAITFKIGDKVVYNGVTNKYEKWDMTDRVDSVNGQEGVVVLDTDDISEGTTNQYFTTTRARTAAVVNTVAGSEIDQAPSVSSIKAYITAQAFLKADGTIPLTADLDADGNKIINLATPTNNADAATKAYVDNAVGNAGSPGDIPEDSAPVANNQASAADVTGLLFSPAVVRSFDALVSVEIDATTGLYESFKLHGIQKGSTFDMAVESVGDESGVVFTITALGQVQYTSSSYAGFVDGEIKFRAITTSF